MPWKSFKRGDEWCVYKLDEDDNPTGDTLGCHPTKEEADKQVAALYVHVNEQAGDSGAAVSELGGSLDDFCERARVSFNQTFAGTFPEGAEGYWVADVFPDHVVVRLGDQYWRVNMTADDDTVTFEPKANWQRVEVVYQPVSETVSVAITETASSVEDTKDIVKEIVETTVVSEFKGQFPNVPPAPGVNIAELINGDDDPMFLTVPISRVGEVSRNGLVHDKALAEALVRQINEDRPGGLMGHLRDEDRATAYPVNAIHWIGALLNNNTVWAKGYIPRTQKEVREEYRIAKAKGAKVATSVYGRAMKEFVNGSHEWRARDFDLESIDLAPYKRAARPGTGEFVITREMGGDKVPADQKSMEAIEMPNKDEIIAELKPADLPDALKKAVLREYEEAHKTQAQIAELTTERDALQQTVSELTAERDQLKEKVAEYERLEIERKAAEEAREFELALGGKIAEMTDWNAADEKAQKALEALRKRFREAILSELNGNRDAKRVEEVVAEIWDNEFSVLAETIRDSLAGPAAFVSGKTNTKFTVDDSPEAIERARAKFGF